MDKYLQEAIDTYERHINGEPLIYMDAATLMDIVEYYENAGKDFEAERCLRFAKRLHPDDPEVLATEAFRLKQRGQWDEALRIIRSINGSNNRDVVLLEAEWAIANGKPQKGIEMIEEQIKATSDATMQADWLLDIGEVLMDYGYNQRAARLLTQIHEDYCEYNRVLELLSDAAFQICDLDKAEKYATKLVDRNPYDAVSWTQLADIQQKAGKYSDALNSAEYALAIDPTSKMGMSMKVYNTFAVGDTDQALKLVNEFTPLMPDDYTMAMYAGEAHYNAGRYEEALPYIRRAIAYCPMGNADHMRLATDLAMLLGCLHRPQEAEEALLSTLESGASLPDIYWKLQSLFSHTDDTSSELDVLKKLSALPNLSEDDLQDLYTLLREKALYVEVPDIWQRLLRQPVPATGHCRTTLAFALFQLHDKEHFPEQLEKALKEDVIVAASMFGKLFAPYKTDDTPLSDIKDYLHLADAIIARWK